MKSRRRHELQENVLGSEITKVVAFFRRRGNVIAWGALVLALIGFVIVYAQRRSTASAARVHGQFDKAMLDDTATPDERVQILRELIDQDDDRRIAAQAHVELGNELAARMLVAGPTIDPLEYKRLAEGATSYYLIVIRTFADQTLPVAEAHLGLGQLAETRGDFDAARMEYQIVLQNKDLSGYPVADRAQMSLDQLDEIARPVAMASTAPATQPTTAPTIQPGQ